MATSSIQLYGTLLLIITIYIDISGTSVGTSSYSSVRLSNQSELCGLMVSSMPGTHSLRRLLMHQCSQGYWKLQEGRTSQSSPNARLPPIYRPISYQLHMDPSLRLLVDFQGNVSIRFKVLQRTMNVVLNTKELQIKSYSLQKERPSARPPKGGYFWDQRFDINSLSQELYQAKSIADTPENSDVPMKTSVAIENLSVNATNEMINFTIAELLEPSHIYTLNISFSGRIRDDLMGFYRTFYLDDNNRRRDMLVTQFQMAEARSAFPCFDEPNLKATFSISVCRPKEMISLSNMPRLSSYQRPGDARKECDQFATTVVMSTYLVAFIVTDFEKRVCSDSIVPMTVYAPKKKIHRSDFTCAVSPKLLDYFQKYTGIPYTLPKLDLVAVPQLFAFGMENWGLITFNGDLLLVDENSTEVEQMKHEAAQVIAHELAHQWFGNIVTSPWWSEIWLNEGLATYLSILSIEAVLPEMNATKWFLAEPQQKTLYHDTFITTRSIYSDHFDLNNLHSIFDGISYWKGSSITRMLRHMVTPYTFQRAIHNFLITYEFKNAGMNEFWEQMTFAAQEDQTMPQGLTVKNVMETWTHNPGYPIVTLSRLQNHSMMISQDRFLRDETKFTALSMAESRLWWIPLSLTIQGYPYTNTTKPHCWIGPSTNSTLVEGFPDPDTWYIVNQRQTGFFRVNYDLQNWKLLVKQFQNNHMVFDEETRCQILDDAFTLANTDQVSYRIPLDIVEFVKDDLSPYVLYIAIQNIFPLTTIYDQDALFGSLSKYFSIIFEKHFENIGLEERRNETHFVNDAKDMLIQRLCNIHPPCVAKAKELFSKWAYNRADYGVAKESLMSTVFCIGISEGGSYEWDLVWEEVKVNRYPKHRDMLISALGCSRHKWILNRYFMKVFTQQNLFSDDILLKVFHSVSSNPNGIDLAWNTLKRLWPQFSLSEDLGQAILQMIIPNMRTPQQLDELQEFLTKASPIDESVLEEPMKTLKKRLHFYNRKYKELFLWEHEKFPETIPA